MDELAIIEPEEMASFLNDLADEYFKNNPGIQQKLAQCSVFIHGCLFAMNKHASHNSHVLRTEENA